MVNDLLDLAKVEAGRVTISPEWFDMVDLFSALRGMFKPILQSHSVSLIFEEPRDIPRIFTDDKKLSQILRNFISNALKFTPDGEVRVSATLVDGRPRDVLPSPTPASASPPSTSARCSRISSRSTRRSRSGCGARASACRSAASWRSSSAATSRSRARSDRAPGSRSPSRWSCR